ncbi:MAG: hypothetical protein LBO06_02455 [Bacteroidales bacterium]|jgi:hypothetical protein|nr:hypothetical protein [Bacteroidales bacterium]
MKVTEEQIKNWKKQHGEIFCVEVDGKSCYLRVPTRAELGFAAESAKTNPLAFNEVILRECWLAGDEEIRTDDGLFLSVSGQLSQMIEIKEAQIKKL